MEDRSTEWGLAWQKAMEARMQETAPALVKFAKINIYN
jgi:hypothetical protein